MKIKEAEKRVVEIKKELGKRNYALFQQLSSEFHSQAGLKAAWHRSNGKKILQKRFLQLYKEYLEIIETFKKAHNQKNVRCFTAGIHAPTFRGYGTSVTSQNITPQWSMRLGPSKDDFNYWGATNAWPISTQIGETTDDLHHRILCGDTGIEWAKRYRSRMIREELNYMTVDTSGNKSVSVSYTDSYSDICLATWTDKGDRYSRSSTWNRTDLNVEATLPIGWYTSVFKNQLSRIDGMLTLWTSAPLRHRYSGGLVNSWSGSEVGSRIEVRAIKYARKSWGASYKTIEGFVALLRDRDTRISNSYHGKTLDSAARGLMKKARLENLCKKPISVILQQASKSKKLVSFADSTAVGNCKEGTLDFCHRHDLNPESKIPLSQLAQIAETDPRREVFSVIRHKLA